LTVRKAKQAKRNIPLPSNITANGNSNGDTTAPDNGGSTAPGNGTATTTGKNGGGSTATGNGGSTAQLTNLFQAPPPSSTKQN
jgi:pullulanase